MWLTPKLEHPGGPKIILKYAGKDSTEEFDPIHPPDTLDKYLPKEKHLGPVNMETVQKEEKEESPEEKKDKKGSRTCRLLRHAIILWTLKVSPDMS